jgi:hypothetical protein
MIVIDDVVDKATQDLIEKMILESDTPHWVYHRGYAAPKRIPQLVRNQSSPSFFFEIVRANNHCLIDPSYTPFLAPLARFDPQKIFKVRCVLHTALRNEDRTNLPPHLDALPEHYETDKFKVAVYYVNDSDGPTTFYKESYQSAIDKGLTDDDILNGRMEIAGQVHPKKGRLVLFDHDVYHASGFAKNGVRSIINYNFL